MVPRTRRALPLLVAIALSLAAAGCDRAPTHPPLCRTLGIDVSRHQGLIDWQRVADSGVRFAWIKATEGGDYMDPLFHRNWLLAGEAGLPRGAYHFVYWCRPAVDQAKWFVANLPVEPGALPPVIDIEWNPGSRSCPDKVARDKALADIKTMVDAVEHAYGQRPILYVPADIFAEILDGSFVDDRLWARALGDQPPSAYGARRWSVWQFAEDGHVPGIDTAVDLDCLAPDETTLLPRDERQAGASR